LDIIVSCLFIHIVCAVEDTWLRILDPKKRRFSSILDNLAERRWYWKL